MRIVKKILKWTGLSIGLLLVLIILAGLGYRLFSSEVGAFGSFVDVGGFKLHMDVSGEKSDQATVVIEGGGGTACQSYHWLSEGLKDHMRVFRYDRAGIGYSDLSQTDRDPETIARELHVLLEKAGESPPYIMVGHSLGGPYIRVFSQLYPDEVAAMVFLDSSHPDQNARLKLPGGGPKNWALTVLTGAGDLGILGFFDLLIGPLFAAEGLPDSINQRTRDYTLNGDIVRGVGAEAKWIDASLDRARETTDFGAMPIRVFTATDRPNESLKAQGIDPDWWQSELIAMHKEIAALSSNGKQMMINGDHGSIFTIQENADVICQEILALQAELQAQR